jgi:hypothetical protein
MSEKTDAATEKGGAPGSGDCPNEAEDVQEAERGPKLKVE